MKLHRALAALFVAASLMLVSFLPLPSMGGQEALAASAKCGAYTGNICRTTESCLWYLFGSICTTDYKYFDTSDSGDDEDREDPVAPEES